MTAENVKAGRFRCPPRMQTRRTIHALRASAGHWAGISAGHGPGYAASPGAPRHDGHLIAVIVGGARLVYCPIRPRRIVRWLRSPPRFMSAVWMGR